MYAVLIIPVATGFVFILVLVSSIIALRNTDKWAPTDICCNLMRSQPACCTKCCSGNKHRCARLSCLYIVASICSSLLLVLVGVAFVVGCMESSTSTFEYYQMVDDAKRSNMEYSAYHDYPRRYPVASTTPYVAADVQVPPSVCVPLLPYQLPLVVLLLSLVVTTARSAWSIRQIENNQPNIAMLPPTKMVTLHAVDNMMTVQSTVVNDASVVDDEETNTELGTEQNA